jgi:hypothetical protein
MEFLLLWIDELDDALCALRHLAPKILGFVVAIALFVGTCVALVRMPQVALAMVAFALSASLVESCRRRRMREKKVSSF